MDYLLDNQKSREECVEYLRKEGILNYFDIEEKKSHSIFDAVDEGNLVPFEPVPEDLYRLHTLIRQRKVFNVLEFGLGYSTIVMADALMKNSKEFYSNPDRPEVRLKNPFVIYSVDSSEYWIKNFNLLYKSKFPYMDYIKLHFSKCSIGTWYGQLCHYYDNLPNVVTDFIYLDGPSANDVEGKINGLSFQHCPERTVMSADLLLMEPTMLPGTMILVDGRTNNARFLMNNFRRNFGRYYIENQDATVFELQELPLGKINRDQIDYSLGTEYYDRIQPKVE